MDSCKTSDPSLLSVQEDEIHNIHAVEDPDVVDFEASDPDNPLHWSVLRKWLIVIAVSSMNLMSVMATTTIVPAAPQVIEDLQVTSPLYRTLLVSIWELGEGIGPFFIAPLSERYGRCPIFYLGNILGLLCGTAGALSVNISMLVAFRFLNGFVVTTLTLAPTIIGDMFLLEERGRAMAVAISMQILGVFVAPICGSFIAQELGWRWTIWVNVVACGAISLLCLIFVRETYAKRILDRKAARLRQETGNTRLRSRYACHVGATTLIQSATFPVQLMIRSPAVSLVSLYMAISYGMSYLITTMLTVIMETQYSFSSGVVGVAFVSCATGNLIGMILYGMTSDRYVKRKKQEQGDKFRAEHRLLHSVGGAILIPIGLVLFGWTLQYHVHYIVPLLSTTIVGVGVVLAMLSTENYLVDAFPTQSASAIAAGVILRAVTGALFPLSGPPLYQHLDHGWGSTVLTFIMLAFVPLLVLLFRRSQKS